MGFIHGALDFILSSWTSIKTFVEYTTNVSHDVLHFLTGLGAWLLIATLTRRPISSVLPLAITLALAVINEAADLWFDIWPERARQVGELAKDLFTTLAVPSLLFVLARLHPALFDVPVRGRAGEADRVAGVGAAPPAKPLPNDAGGA